MGLDLAAADAALAALDPNLLPRLPLLGPVLGVAFPDNELTAAFDAKLRKTSLEALLVACLRALAGRGPLLLVLEDNHWIDALSHDLLEVIGRPIVGLPVLIVLTYRPPQLECLQAPRVGLQAHFTPIPLADLSPTDAEQLIRQRLEQRADGQVAIPDALIGRITARSQGNPFYIEELLNDLRDQGIDPGDPAAIARLDLPSSLHSLILTRIDRLPERQRITLKVASVVGRVFQSQALLGASPMLGTVAQIDADLEELGRLDLVPLERAEPERSYLFKHIVTQEVAYESLPFATRETLHGRLAAFLERGGSEMIPPIDLLAFHYGRSDNPAKKREYFLRAGAAAQSSYANAAAVEYYRAALPLLTAEERAATLLRLGQVHELTGQWDEARECYRDALATAHGDVRAEARGELAIGELLRKRGAYDEAAEHLARARAGFEAAGDEAGVGEALHYAGNMAAQRGNLRQSAAPAAPQRPRCAARSVEGSAAGAPQRVVAHAILVRSGDVGRSARGLAARQPTRGRWWR
jgi:predicted ATPase